jgi:hypothetical protein
MIVKRLQALSAIDASSKLTVSAPSGTPSGMQLQLLDRLQNK